MKDLNRPEKKKLLSNTQIPLHSKINRKREAFNQAHDLCMTWHEQKIGKVKDVKNIQCSKGNYDQGEYMRGMANGLILAEAILENKDPEYFKAITEPKGE